MNLSKNQISAELLPNSANNNGFLRSLRRFFQNNEYAYLSYAFFTPVALFFLIYLAMGLHPFGDGSVLVLDLNGQYVSFYEMLRSAVYGDASLIYSFERALGGEFMGIYAYYLASPFSYIVALFPKERILEALLTIFLLKSGLCGLTFGWYLHRNTREGSRSKITIVTFATLYAMSAYCVVQQHNSMWIDAVIWLPILAYSIEQLIKFGKYKLFVLILALTVCSNYYIGYMVCIFVAAYFFYYYFANDEKTEESEHPLNNPRKERRHFRKSLIRIGFYSAVAIGMAAIIVFTAYYSLKFGKSTFSSPNWAMSLKFEFMDFLTKFLPGSYDTVRPEGLPFVYCGLVTVMLIPIYFCSRKFSRREKIASGILIVFFILSFVCSTLDLIWHGFQRPNWLNYRYSFMLCFVLLVLAYRAFGEIRKVTSTMIFAIGASIIGFVVIAQKMTFTSYVENEEQLLAIETVLLTLVCVSAYAIILAVARKTKQRESIAMILAIVCCLEVYCSGLTCDVQFGDDVVYTKYSAYNNYMNDLRPVTEALKIADPSFYRMEKTSMRKTNDSMALDMNSLCCSTSTLNQETIDFLRYVGYASKSNWSKYLGGTPVNDSLLGLKYLISKEELTDLYEEFELELSEEEADNPYTVYLNPYALSIAFGANEKVNTLDLSSYSKFGNPMERLNAIVSAILGEDQTLSLFTAVDEGTPTLQNCKETSVGSYMKYSPENADKTASLSYAIHTPTDQGDRVELFFFLSADQYTREVSLKVNGSSVGGFGGNETNRIVSLGTFDAGARINLEVSIKNDSNTLYVKKASDCIYYVDKEVFADAFTRIKEGPQYEIENGCSNDHLIGTISTTEANQMIMTTIPYDEGFTILLNGESIPYEKTLDSLICFTIEEAGDYTLEFVYRPKMLVLGAAISCASAALFIFLCLFEKKFRAFAWGKGGRTIGVNDHDDTDILAYDPSTWNYGFLLEDETNVPEPFVENAEVQEDEQESSVAEDSAEPSDDIIASEQIDIISDEATDTEASEEATSAEE